MFDIAEFKLSLDQEDGSLVVKYKDFEIPYEDTVGVKYEKGCSLDEMDDWAELVLNSAIRMFIDVKKGCRTNAEKL